MLHTTMPEEWNRTAILLVFQFYFYHFNLNLLRWKSDINTVVTNTPLDNSLSFSKPVQASHHTLCSPTCIAVIMSLLAACDTLRCCLLDWSALHDRFLMTLAATWHKSSLKAWSCSTIALRHPCMAQRRAYNNQSKKVNNAHLVPILTVFSHLYLSKHVFRYWLLNKKDQDVRVSINLTYTSESI